MRVSVYLVFIFNRENYPSTTEYQSIFGTRQEAEKYIKKNKVGGLQEIYIEEKIVEIQDNTKQLKEENTQLKYQIERLKDSFQR
jgi:hypothetical protein